MLNLQQVFLSISSNLYYRYNKSQPSKQKVIRYSYTLFSQSHFWVEQQRGRKEGGGGYRDLAASKIETFVIIVYLSKPLTISAKGSILDITRGPDPYQKSDSITLFTLLERSFEKKLIRGNFTKISALAYSGHFYANTSIDTLN